nr:MAG TPA: hypothetical protein [Microviridae sp.]
MTVMILLIPSVMLFPLSLWLVFLLRFLRIPLMFR